MIALVLLVVCYWWWTCSRYCCGDGSQRGGHGDGSEDSGNVSSNGCGGGGCAVRIHTYPLCIPLSCHQPAPTAPATPRRGVNTPSTTPPTMTTLKPRRTSCLTPAIHLSLLQHLYHYHTSTHHPASATLHCHSLSQPLSPSRPLPPLNSPPPPLPPPPL